MGDNGEPTQCVFFDLFQSPALFVLQLHGGRRVYASLVCHRILHCPLLVAHAHERVTAMQMTAILGGL
jgi:hypothetical protein